MTNDTNSTSRSFRDVVATIFRRRRLLVGSFFVIFGLASAALVLRPETYEAEMKIMVKRGRVEPMVSTESGALTRVADITEQDLSSEIELLRSRDLLEQAVADCSLAIPRRTPFQLVFGGAMELNAASSRSSDPAASQLAVHRLEEDLQILPLSGSNVIAASYQSDDPDSAACVLNALSKLYVEKHLAVHRPAGAFEFFRAEAERFRGELTKVELQLVETAPQASLLTSSIEKDATAQAFADLSSTIAERKASLAAVEARINELERQSTTVEDRHVTEVRTSQDPRASELKSTLMNLRLERLELLQRYSPTYRAVQEMDARIQEVEKELAAAEQKPVVEQVTNRDPAFDWIRLELARAQSEVTFLKAEIPAAATLAADFKTRAAELERAEMRRRDLQRMATVVEENYLLYLRKQEEARISEALDRGRFVNVAIAEPATVPLVPVQTNQPLRFSLAAVLAGLLSFGAALGADCAGRAFHRPTDIEAALGVPALASYPTIRERKS